MTDSPVDPLRTCKHCGRDWPLSDYKRDGYGYLGHRCRECRQPIDRKASRAYADRHLERERERKRVMSRTPEAKAREAVRKAVTAGRLVRSATCDSCGTEAPTEGHHHLGYDDPLVVVWLCRPCHSRTHRKAVTA